MVMVLEVAVVGLAQPSLDVNVTAITSPLFKALLLYVAELPPTFAPLTVHWYAGVVPPLVGLAVNVTLVPAHIAPDGFATIPTDGTNTEFICTVIVLEVADAGFAHGLIDVNTTETTSLFERPVLL
jgi:hypothetical protein